MSQQNHSPKLFKWMIARLVNFLINMPTKQNPKPNRKLKQIYFFVKGAAVNITVNEFDECIYNIKLKVRNADMITIIEGIGGNIPLG